MKILYLHGWQSVPGGAKPTFLAQHGHEAIKAPWDISWPKTTINGGKAGEQAEEEEKAPAHDQRIKMTAVGGWSPGFSEGTSWWSLPPSEGYRPILKSMKTPRASTSAATRRR